MAEEVSRASRAAMQGGLLAQQLNAATNEGVIEYSVSLVGR